MHIALAPRLGASILLASAAGLAGCASTDATPDIRRAASTVAERSALSPDWSTDWTTAAAWNATTPLSADEAVGIALVRNRSLRAAVNEIAMAKAELAAAETPPNPVVSFAYGAPTDGGPGSMITASVMTQLAWLWRRPSEVAAAEASLRAATLRAADSALATIADVRVMHAQVLAAEAEAAFAATADDAMTALAALIADQHAAGLVSASDARSAESKASATHRERINAEAELHHMKVALLDALAMSDAPLQWTTDGVWPSEPMPADPELVALDAPARRLDVAALAADLLASDEAARRAGLERLPMVDLGVMFERSMEGEEVLGPSISATVPIFDRGDAAIAQAAAKREAARLALDSAIHATRSEARTAAMTWIAARSAWSDGSERARRLAEGELQSVREAVTNGAADRVSEQEAVAMLAERSMVAVRDRLKAVEASVRFERAIGGHPAATPSDPTAVAANNGRGGDR
jgi:cobalt-zinc-cadmium efflux system outer membrane protein